MSRVAGTVIAMQVAGCGAGSGVVPATLAASLDLEADSSCALGNLEVQSSPGESRVGYLFPLCDEATAGSVSTALVEEGQVSGFWICVAPAKLDDMFPFRPACTHEASSDPYGISAGFLDGADGYVDGETTGGRACAGGWGQPNLRGELIDITQGPGTFTATFDVTLTGYCDSVPVDGDWEDRESPQGRLVVVGSY